MDKRRLNILLKSLEAVIDNDIEGDVVEFGCFIGTTSLFLRRMLDELNSSKTLHVYDSFVGLPDKTIEDASVAGSEFKAGELKASKRSLIRNFKKAGLRIPKIHKSWFRDLKPKDLPDVIAFGFIDGDFYNSIVDSLELVWPRLSVGGQLVVDDFMSSNLPGVTRAISDFFIGSDVKIEHRNNLAIVYK
jgi:O-methyltransferase